MSRCSVGNYGYGLTGAAGMGGLGGFAGRGCVCSLPCLIILILVVLQFSKNCPKEYCDDDRYNRCECGNQQIGNGILFIITLFFLSCVGCGRGCGYGGGY